MSNTTIPAHHMSAIMNASSAITCASISALTMLVCEDKPFKTEKEHVVDKEHFKETCTVVTGLLAELQDDIAFTFVERSYDDLDQEIPSLRHKFFMRRAEEMVSRKLLHAFDAAFGSSRLIPRTPKAIVHLLGRATYEEAVTAVDREVMRRMRLDCEQKVKEFLVPLGEIPYRPRDPRNSEDPRGIPDSACF